MTHEFVQAIGRFNKPGSISSHFKNSVDYHDRHWRDKDWNNAAHPPTSSFWLYKTADCVVFVMELKEEIESAYQKGPGGLYASTLIGGIATQLANFYRGAWIAETFAAGTLLPDLTDETQDVVFALLDRAEALHAVNCRKRVVDAALRGELLAICDQMLARYDVLIDALDPEWRADVRQGIVRKSKHYV